MSRDKARDVLVPTLEQMLESEGTLPPGPAVLLASQLAGELARLHRGGQVYGDLRPHRVQVAPDGNARLAGERNGAADSARGNAILYESPEVIAGEPPSAASDVYALGVLLFEMIGGSRTVFASGLAGGRIERHPSELIPGLPLAVDKCVLACLDPDPAQRPSSAELGAWLEGVLDGPHSKEMARPQPRAASLLVLCVVLLAAAGGALLTRPEDVSKGPAGDRPARVAVQKTSARTQPAKTASGELAPAWTSPCRPFEHLVTVCARERSVAIVWAEDLGSSGSHVTMRTSADGGRTWGGPELLRFVPDGQWISCLTSVWTSKGLTVAFKAGSNDDFNFYLFPHAGEDFSFDSPRITKGFADDFCLADAGEGNLEMLSWSSTERKEPVDVFYRVIRPEDPELPEGRRTFRLSQECWNGREPVFLHRTGDRLLTVTGPRFAALAPVESQWSTDPRAGEWSTPSSMDLSPGTHVGDVWAAAAKDLVLLLSSSLDRGLAISRDAGATFRQRTDPMEGYGSHGALAAGPDGRIYRASATHGSVDDGPELRVTATPDGERWSPVRSSKLAAQNPGVVELAVTSESLVVPVVFFELGLWVYVLPLPGEAELVPERPVRARTGGGGSGS